MNSWMEVLGQWRLGILYPRWAALAHFGYGEARFIFYPPASWMLGAALGSFLPWKIVPVCMSGLRSRSRAAPCSCWRAAIWRGGRHLRRRLLRRQSLSHRHRVLAQCICRVARRRASAAAPAGGPALRRRSNSKPILSLALIVAAAWLTNIPSAVMLTYSLALLLIVAADHPPLLRPWRLALSALLIGLALAAFYIVPVLYEQKWVEIAQVLSPGVRPQDNFLFTSLNNPDHDRFNLLISLLSTAEIILLAIFCFLSRSWRTRAPRVVVDAYRLVRGLRAAPFFCQLFALSLSPRTALRATAACAGCSA